MKVSVTLDIDARELKALKNLLQKHNGIRHDEYKSVITKIVKNHLSKSNDLKSRH